MKRRGTAVLLSALLVALILPTYATAAAAWSLSMKAAAGRVVVVQYSTPRVGLEVDQLDVLTHGLDLGIEGGWWEEVGSQGFAYGDGGPDDPLDVHQRAFAIAALLRASARVNDSRPYFLIGAGEYLTVRRYRYLDGNTRSRSSIDPGLSLGVGILGSTRPALVVQARWHHILSNSDPYDLTRMSTDLFLVSAGLSFE